MGNFGVICEYKLKITEFNNGNPNIMFNLNIYLPKNDREDLIIMAANNCKKLTDKKQ